jgi:hypothetical protein
MSLDDFDSRLLPTTKKKIYLDIIEFVVAEYDKDADKPTDVNSRNSRKWTENKIVDLDILKRHHMIIEEIFQIVQENILLAKIENINIFTLYLPLGALFFSAPSHILTNLVTNFSRSKPINYAQILEKKKSIVDMKTLKALNEDQQINWSPTVSSLYPIITLADGNCLVNLLILC